MDWVYFCLGVGLLALVVCLVSAIEETFAGARIKAPPKLPFALVRLEEEQFKTVIAPAIAALASGLLVSLSASYFFEASRTQSDEVMLEVSGIVLFIAGAFALVITLRLALGKNRKILEHVRAPHHLRAAAVAAAEDPRHAPLPHYELASRLDTRKKSIAVHSLGIDKDVEAKALLSAMEKSLSSKKPHLWSSLRIYCAALRRFPLRFVLPLLVLIVFLVGVWGTAFDLGISSLGAFAIFAGLTLGGATIVLFYLVARGNRARRTYAMNIGEVEDARRAVDKAAAAYQEMLAEEKSRAAFEERVRTHFEQVFAERAAQAESDGDRNDDDGGGGGQILRLTLGMWSLEISRTVKGRPLRPGHSTQCR